MTTSRRQLCRTTVFVFIILLVVILAIWTLGLASVPILPITYVAVANNKNIVAANPLLHDMLNGAHNFRRPNHVITEYDDNVAARLATLVERRATAADPDVIRLIVDMLDPPSTHMVKMSRQLLSTPQSREVDKILNQKRGGFYVECGALDGERSSNTLYLERERGWTGLLVEMDPYFYTQLIGRSRRSWSINACLSPQPYVTQLPFMESSGGQGKLMAGQSRQSKNSRMVPCFPLDALLVALHQSSVDYLSLDVEGFELEILRTIPFHQINVSVLSVEYAHGNSDKRSYADFMNQQGYAVHKDIHFADVRISLYVEDFIFVKKTLNYTKS